MDRPNPRTLTRDQIASLTPRVDVQRALEAFFRYLIDSLPTAVEENTLLIEYAQEAADNAAAISAMSQAIAVSALDIAKTLNESPPVHIYPALEPDDNTHLIRQLEAQIHELSRRISALEEKP